MRRNTKLCMGIVAAIILMLSIVAAIELTYRDFNGQIDVQAYGLEINSSSHTFVLSNVTGDSETIELNITNTGEQKVYVTYQLIDLDPNVNVTITDLASVLDPGATDHFNMTITLIAPTIDSTFIARFIATEP
jgi:hypothetical protein